MTNQNKMNEDTVACNISIKRKPKLLLFEISTNVLWVDNSYEIDLLRNAPRKNNRKMRQLDQERKESIEKTNIKISGGGFCSNLQNYPWEGSLISKLSLSKGKRVSDMDLGYQSCHTDEPLIKGCLLCKAKWPQVPKAKDGSLTTLCGRGYWG